MKLARPMRESKMTRRRALTALGVAAGVPLALLAADRRAAPPVLRWRGTALGALAAITLCHPNRAAARATLAACLAEIERLEAVFSLYRADSELSALNRDGRLDLPSRDLVALLAQARRFGALSGGAFDVTVQPLWRLYAAHFADPRADPRGPPAQAVRAALARVDYRAIEIAPRAVRLARHGMALTLNGIAQGAITDRIAAMLRDAGFEQALVDLGELRAVGGGPNGAWRIGLAGPDGVSDTTRLADGALATSAGYGTRFEPSGRFHHLFDPRNGRSAAAVTSASAFASRAVAADALATTLAVSAPDRAGEILARFGGQRARLVLPGGAVRIVTPHA